MAKTSIRPVSRLGHKSVDRRRAELAQKLVALCGDAVAICDGTSSLIQIRMRSAVEAIQRCLLYALEMNI